MYSFLFDDNKLMYKANNQRLFPSIIPVVFNSTKTNTTIIYVTRHLRYRDLI